MTTGENNVNKDELTKIISDHAKWLSGEGGARANLSYANLSYANLNGANLNDANLRGANLNDAYLRGCVGDRQRIKSLFVSKAYPITYTSEVLQIGCERHKIGYWWEFSDRQVIQMDGKTALEFWREWKDTIRMIIEKSPAS